MAGVLEVLKNDLRKKYMSSRWQKAIQSEADFWKAKRDFIREPEYRQEIEARARRVEQWLNTFVRINENNNILEIGGGGTQLIDFFTKGNKYALDPLADFYQENFGDVLNPEVKWTQGKAEALPYPAEFFDIVIARNTLDHVDTPTQALAEIHRVLRPNGLVYLGVNTLSGILYWLRLVKKAAEHPSVFSRSGISRQFRKANFAIVDSIEDAPENMRTFVQEPLSRGYRAILHHIFLKLGCYHFSEFLLGKSHERE